MNLLDITFTRSAMLIGSKLNDKKGQLALAKRINIYY
jgi:hypothetical protein